MAKIIIELKSDLCTANGEGFASIIDTDVCYDRYGIPYIPSRRLKGCLREAAELIGTVGIDSIFGVIGSEAGGSLSLSDALLSDYDDIKTEVDGYDPEDVLQLFTYVRAQTAIERESGVAKDDSLRLMRVVKKYSPTDNREALKFEASCDIDPKYEARLSMICRALRNIGYKRTRGFGAVKCSFEGNKASGNLLSVPELDPVKEYTIRIRIENKLPLILSSGSEDDTLDYISGTMLQGAFAWKYPDKDSDRFRDIFFGGGVRFSNCYLGDEPVPLVYAKMKKSEEYYNTIDDNLPMDDIPKPVKRGYIDGDGCIIEAKKEVVYHHRRRMPSQGGTSEDDALLYTQTALSAGQVFYGSINGKGEYLSELLGLYPDRKIRFGRSKTAQYGLCEMSIEAVSDYASDTPLGVDSEEIVVTMASDVALYDGAVCTVDLERLNAEIWKRLGQAAIEPNKKESSLAYAVRTGYSGVWNLKKPQTKVFVAGSALVYDSVSGELPRDFYIGAKQSEGFGHCRVIRKSNMPAINGKRTVASRSQADSTATKGVYSDLLKEFRDDRMLCEKAIDFAKNNRLPVSISQISRVRRMAEESEDRNDFNARIESIKTDSVRGYVQTFIKEYDEAMRTETDIGRYPIFKKGLDIALREQIYAEKNISEDGGDA
jgi:CRISPR/Cas system CSM-associated protein Csm3 (group 7 of RAMP superfamily)